MIYTYRHTTDVDDSMDGFAARCLSDEFERSERMADTPLVVCPMCCAPVERIIYPGQRPIGGSTPIHH